MKAIEKAMTSEDVSEAMDELRESVDKIVTSMGNIAKSIDWKSVAPKIIMGMMVLYGIRNRKLLSGIVSSMLIGLITEKVAEASAKA